MTPQKYLMQELEALKTLHPETIDSNILPDEIFRIIMSKKFRKWSVSPELVVQVKNAIKINIGKNQPINLTFPQGAYKLWRLEEAPLPDWAELFAAMYYTAWLKPICEMYPPGVWFEYFVDDLIVPKIDNISLDDVYAYLSEHEKILNFLNSYQPKNFRMTITRFESLFPSQDAFDRSLRDAIDKFSQKNPHPVFTDRQLEMVYLNARPTKEQLADPQWKEKILMIHDPYMVMKREIGYYYKPDKIPVFNQPLPSGKFIAVGTTKTSIAKFWVGIGALKKNNDSFKEYILSPKQMEREIFTKATMNIPGLDLKNFHSIRLFT